MSLTVVKENYELDKILHVGLVFEFVVLCVSELSHFCQLHYDVILLIYLFKRKQHFTLMK